MKIFLTGGTGLLGSHFAEMATTEGATVVSLVRPNSDTAYLKALGITLAPGSLQDVESLASGMTGCDVVVHAASPVGMWGKPDRYEEGTVGGTRNVVAAMEASSVRTLIHISTISVHGLDPIKGQIINEASGFGSHFLPYDHYGQAKVAAEKVVKEAHILGKIEATVLRPGWMYGPRDNNSYGRLADTMRRGLAIQIGNGENQIALIYAGNVAWAMWAALAKPSSDYRVYLCASDGAITQGGYLQSIARVTGTTRRPISLPKGLLLDLGLLQEYLSILFGYRIPVLLSRHAVHLLGSDWRFDQSCIERDLGYSPRVGYEQGFAATEQWYRESRSMI